MHEPTLVFLDTGLDCLYSPWHSGRILVMSPGHPPRVLVEHESLPDGLDSAGGRLYWTNMGAPKDNDGCVRSCQLDGSDVKTIVPKGIIHTPKQLVVEHESQKLYICDREGLRIWRCNYDGSETEILIQTGDWQNPEDQMDQMKWPIGVAVDTKDRKLYWTQKGPSKGNRGRILRANLDLPEGHGPSGRTDVECLLSGLPEPIDLDFDSDERMLYWTDRGDPPLGNSINKASVDTIGQKMAGSPGYETVARKLNEAIGLKFDRSTKDIYVTDLGGRIYRFDRHGNGREVLDEAEVDGAYSGISLL